MTTLTIEQLALDIAQWRKTDTRRYKSYPEDLKNKVISFKHQYPLNELSKRLNIPTQSLERWMWREKITSSLEAPISNHALSFIELPTITPPQNIILKLTSGIKFIFEGEVKTEYLAELVQALSRREFS